MIAAIAGLLVCQLIGEVLVRALALPVPGPVVGLGFMFAFLVWRGRSREHAVPTDLGRVADAFLGNLSLLFIPAAVGVVQYLGLLRQFAGPIAVAVAVSTTAALVVTALVFRFVSRLHAFRHEPLAQDVEGFARSKASSVTALPIRAGEIWVYLAASPLFWLTAVLLTYLGAERIADFCHRHPLANTVAISALILGTLLVVTGTPYDTFFSGAQFVHFLLGPATVALAIPLYRNLGRVRATMVPMSCALVAGSLTAITTVVIVGGVLGLPVDVLASLAPKSVTTPIAMSLAKANGGIPALTAVFVMLTGVFGAVVVTPLMNLMRIRDYAARGFAAGLAAHGIGTARAFQVDALAGAFAGIALGLNGAVTALVTPLILPPLLHFFGG